MRKAIVLAIFMSISAIGVAQVQKDTLTKKLDSLAIKKPADSAQRPTKSDVSPEKYNAATNITFKNYFQLLGSNFKQQMVLPFHTKGKQWLTVGKLALVIGTTAFFDKPINKYFVEQVNTNSGVRSVSKNVTNFGGLYEVYILTGMTIGGWVFKKPKMKTTTLLATQAYITAGLLQEVLKFLTGRQRPNYYDKITIQNAPTFHGPFYQFQKNADGTKKSSAQYSSFPSGHTTAAFSAATVFAFEYRDKPWVPILSYSAATLIGLSRLSENKHWATDVLVGAALGYFTGKQISNNYHRFAKIKAPEAPIRKRKRNPASLSFNFQMMNGVIVPGLIYQF